MPSSPGAAAAVFDQSASRRPDEKLGVMFRGSAVVRHLDGNRATISIRSEKVTTWDGFEAETAKVER